MYGPVVNALETPLSEGWFGMIIKNGVVHDAVNKEPYRADIVVRDGKIIGIGEVVEVLAGEEIMDATGLQIYPGLVEAHSHLGLRAYGISELGVDHNEKSDILTPHLRAIDSFHPQDAAVRKALEGGVTTVCTGPGSTNVLGGTFIVTKTHGKCVDRMVLREPAAMKCAFGENPKVTYKGKSCGTRMAISGKLREMLFLSRDYMLRKEAAAGDITKMPKYDMKAEAMIPVLKKEIPLKAHAHRADDICTAIRIAKEFDVALTLEHCTEGHLIVEELMEAGYPIVVGPSMGGASKLELIHKTFDTARILSEAGIPISITTDAPVFPQEYLPLCAGMAVKAGMEPFAALQAITINPARHIGVADRVGTIETGKDGDLILTDGDLLDNHTIITSVIVNGKKVV